VWFSFVAGGFILIPAFGMVMNTKDRRETFPELYTEPPSRLSYFRTYVSYFRSFLMMVGVFYFGLVAGVSLSAGRIVIRVILWSPFAAGAVGLGWLFFSLKRRHSKEQAQRVVWDSLSLTFMSFIWFVLAHADYSHSS
jgi:hypothetical protein